MTIKNRRNSSKIKGFGSYQTWCLTQSLVLRNRLLFIYKTVVVNLKINKMRIALLVPLTILLPCLGYAQDFNGYTLDEIQAIHADFDTNQQSNKGEILPAI